MACLASHLLLVSRTATLGDLEQQEFTLSPLEEKSLNGGSQARPRSLQGLWGMVLPCLFGFWWPLAFPK